MRTADIARNLRLYRSDRRLSQEALAERAGLSRAGYRKLEQGASVPRERTLVALAQALDVSLPQLLTPAPQLRRVRFRSQKQLRSRQLIVAEVAARLASFAELESLLDHAPAPSILAGAWPEDPRQAAAAARARLGLSESEAIRDLAGLLEARGGVKVLFLPKSSDGFFGLSVGAEDGGPAIVVNTSRSISVERWIFTAAHELGHLLLHPDAYELGADREELGEERQANEFAAHFLMPDAAFENEWRDARGLPLVDAVLKLKRIFRVSYRTVLYRLAAREELGTAVWRHFQGAHQRRSGRALLRADEPAALGPDAFQAQAPAGPPAAEPAGLSPWDFVEDRLSRLVREALDSGQISLGRGAEILGLALPEMRERAASWAA